MTLKSQRMLRLQLMIQETPDDLFLQYALAIEYLGMGSKTEAEKIFRHVILRDNTYVAAYYQLGLLLGEAGRIEEAITYLKLGMNFTSNQKTKNEFRSLIDEIEC